MLANTCYFFVLAVNVVNRVLSTVNYTFVTTGQGFGLPALSHAGDLSWTKRRNTKQRSG